MQDYDVIIIGGGPAGGACAGELSRNGVKCRILDKQQFPRNKLCAGWVTPDIFHDLKVSVNDYPCDLTTFNELYFHLRKKEFRFKTRQYAVRRHEFDHWLLETAGVPVSTHHVRKIDRKNDLYIIDDLYRCKYLVGAGGTHCPVYKHFFSDINPRSRDKLVVTLEEEFPHEFEISDCHLWFFNNGLPGYAWYVPKTGGYVNTGIGAYLSGLRKHNENIAYHWNLFVKYLLQNGMIRDHRFNPGSAIYYVRDNVDQVQNNGAFIIGDAAGLATQDMGEGIGPAIQSGILVAQAIITGSDVSFQDVKKQSFDRHKLAFSLLRSFIPFA